MHAWLHTHTPGGLEDFQHDPVALRSDAVRAIPAPALPTVAARGSPGGVCGTNGTVDAPPRAIVPISAVHGVEGCERVGHRTSHVFNDEY